MTNIYWIRPHGIKVRRQNGAYDSHRMFPVIRISVLAIMGLALLVFPYSGISADETAPKSAPDQTVAPKENVLNHAGITFKFTNRRDPFLNPLLRKKAASGDQEIDRGVPPPGIAGTYIAEAELKGISIKDKDGRLAILKGNGNRAYFLREGDRLFDGYLKTIHRDSITLVRETKMRSGKVLTQEVIKKLRTP